MPPEKLRIFIVDDHQMMIDGLSVNLENTGLFKVIGSAVNGKELFSALEKVSIDVLLLDIALSDNEYAFDIVTRLKREYPAIKIIMVTGDDTVDMVRKYLDEGAHGYVIKDVNVSELAEGIIKVMEGKTFLSQKIQAQYLEYMNQEFEEAEVAAPIKITLREREIIILIAQELSSKEIANRLFITKNTVETHRKNLFKKLDVKNSIGLVKYAFKNGLI